MRDWVRWRKGALRMAVLDGPRRRASLEATAPGTTSRGCHPARDSDICRPGQRPWPLRLPRSACWGDFNILREVARGGMGIVYEAEQVSLPRAGWR